MQHLQKTQHVQSAQFGFSLFVGIFVLLAGIFIATIAAIGFAHIALGVAMIALALVKRYSQQQEQSEYAIQSLPVDLSSRSQAS